jgi:putative transposase
MPRDWRRQVNQPQRDAELAALRRCVQRGSPYGDQAWVQSTVQRLGLESSLRQQSRPRTSSPPSD